MGVSSSVGYWGYHSASTLHLGMFHNACSEPQAVLLDVCCTKQLGLLHRRLCHVVGQPPGRASPLDRAQQLPLSNCAGRKPKCTATSYEQHSNHMMTPGPLPATMRRQSRSHLPTPPTLVAPLPRRTRTPRCSPQAKRLPCSLHHSDSFSLLVAPLLSFPFLGRKDSVRAELHMSGHAPAPEIDSGQLPARVPTLQVVYLGPLPSPPRALDRTQLEH